MYHPDQFNIVMIDTPADPPPPPMRSACLVEGCPCKDARIVSHRRAAFFAAMARRTGETADRVVPVEASWSFDWTNLTVDAIPAGGQVPQGLAA